MEQVKKIITIDLSEYGAEGTITMRKPSPRKQNEYMNALSKYVDVSTKKILPGAPIGDLELLSVLQYISEAPFKMSVEGLLRFTDDMDPDRAIEFVEKLKESTKEIAGYSPFAQSPSISPETLG